MRNLLFIFLSSLVFVSYACKNKKDEHKQIHENTADYIDNESPRVVIVEEEIEDEAETRKIKDGSYTADIEYYNSTTGVNTLFVTKVHVSNGYLRDIKWPGGIWIHSEYFQPEKIKRDGTCTIQNIEEGYETKVTILDLEYL